MSWRRRDVAGFSLSFLDLLCCGLGAMLLLFILSERSQQEENGKLARLASTAREAVEGRRSGSGTEAIESFAGWVRGASASTASTERIAQAGSDVAGQIGMLSRARRLLVLVDSSGSMARYLPDEPAFADLPEFLRTDGPKWNATVEAVRDLLARASGLEGFRIHLLTDGMPGRLAGASVHPVDSAWATPDAASITAAIGALSAVRPAGGSNHHDSLEAVLSGAWTPPGSGNPLPADTIVLITDGLPNHGPVFENRPADPRIHPVADPAVPGSEWVTKSSRSERADKTLAMLGEKRSRREGPPAVLHVVLMPWPDDPALIHFALRMSAPTGGSVVVMPQGVPD